MPDGPPARKMVSFRLPVLLIERWDRISYLLRRPKGAVAKDALERHLDALERRHPDLAQAEEPDARTR